MISDRLTSQENQIISLLIAGDESGMSILYDNYGGALNTIILKVIPDKELAREILQDVFVKIWKNIETYSAEKSKFFTWMARIAKNSAIDATRSKRFKKNTKTDSLDNSVSMFESGSEDIPVENIGLKELLKHLDEDHRKIIDLPYFQDYTQTEVEKELGIPLGTVKTRARRAIQKLRDHLRGDIFISVVLFIGTLFLILSNYL
ncbi:MAG: sigma-70 family RNA polymerase sigma factor [Saprospiraceae bacterium]